jgi:hypothetical protein
MIAEDPPNGNSTNTRRRQTTMKITPEQLENYRSQISGLTAEIDLHEKELATWKARGEAERNLYRWLAEVTIDPGFRKTNLTTYCDAHKAHYLAESDLKELAILRMKSQLGILRAIVQEGDRAIVDPGVSKIIT